MRTKTILLMAAVAAVGAGTSMAQVFSVNAVGYVNKTVPANGFALISNPLKAATNSIAALFAGAPDGFKVYKYTPGTGYKIYQYDELIGTFDPDASQANVLPGEGVFVQNPLSTPYTVTFVGEVPQGTLTTPLVAGFQIVSSQVPQAGNVKDLGLQGAPGDKVYQFITNDPTPANNQKYYISQFDDLVGDWDPALKSLDVGEAVFLQKVAAGTWTRTFNVNQ
jgi:hypothetical protein